jgi:hypothetical protein
LFTRSPENGKAGGNVPAGSPLGRSEMQYHLLFLLLIVVLVGVRVKITIDKP